MCAHIDDPVLRVAHTRFPHMPERKVVLALPAPARVLLLILEVLLALSLRIGGSDEIGEGARGVVRVPRARELDAYPPPRDLARRADRYAVVDGEEVPRLAGAIPPRGGVAGEEEKDERA